MSASWEDVAKDLEVEYVKAKEALEDCWVENEHLEGVVSQQQAEITTLRAELDAKEALCLKLNDIERLERVNAQQEEEIKSLRARLDKACFPREVWAKQRVPSLASITCNETISVQSPSGCTKDDDEVKEGLERRLERTPSFFFRKMCSITVEEKQRQGELEGLQVLLKEREQKIADLEKELEQVKQTASKKLEVAKKEMAHLESENRDREDKLMNLQCQLAEYMLNEAGSTSCGMTTEWPLKSSPGASQDDLWQCPFPMDEKVDDDEISLKIDSNASFSSTTSLASSIFQKCSISLGAPFSRTSGDPTETEKELLRQLEFLQEESRYERADLEREIQERDSAIQKYQKIISRQEEAIQTLERNCDGPKGQTALPRSVC